MPIYNFKSLALIGLLAVTACKTVPSEYGHGDPVKPLTTEERVQAAMRNAAIESKKGRVMAGALQASEAKYKKAPNNGTYAVDYARDLRLVGLTEQAQMILRPFAVNANKSNANILVEYTKIKLELGDFEGAQIYAQEAMTLDPKSAMAHNVLGVAVDAQGHHQAAENHYRKALGLLPANDPRTASVKNNLALSLIAQGRLAEAKPLLSDAYADDPVTSGTLSANRALVNAL